MIGQEPDSSYCLKRWQGFTGRTLEYTLKDLFNGDLRDPRQVLIEYRIGKDCFGLFTVSDLDWFHSLVSQEPDKDVMPYVSNLVGRISERLAWRITRYWLDHFSVDGNVTSNDYEEGHNFNNSSKYILKVKNSPNLVLLERTRAEKSNYRVWDKELDGIYEYELHGERYVFVLETKIEGLGIKKDSLEMKLFEPLREVYPDTRIIYLIYSKMSSVYQHAKTDEERLRRGNLIKPEPVDIYNMFRDIGVGTMFFGFRESALDIGDMIKHIIKHTDLLNNKEIPVRAYLSQKRVKVMLGDTPALLLDLIDPAQGLWQQRPISRKKVRYQAAQ